MAKIALWVRCKNCGKPFDTGIRLEDRAFARGTFAANYHACPHCGVRASYRKADYDQQSAPVGRPGARGAG